MSAQDVVVVGGVATMLTQALKRAGLPDKMGPAIVMVVSALLVGVWAYARGQYVQALAWDYVAGWVGVTAAAMGVYSAVRAADDAATSFRNRGTGDGNAPPPPPAGA